MNIYQLRDFGYRLIRRRLICILLLLIAGYCSQITVKAHEGEDHSKDKPQTTVATTGKSAVTIACAERNVQTDGVQFNVQFTACSRRCANRGTSEFAVRIAEKVEGGFGGGEPLPLEDANVSADITTADGQDFPFNRTCNRNRQ